MRTDHLEQTPHPRGRRIAKLTHPPHPEHELRLRNSRRSRNPRSNPSTARSQITSHAPEHRCPGHLDSIRDPKPAPSDDEELRRAALSRSQPASIQPELDEDETRGENQQRQQKYVSIRPASVTADATMPPRATTMTPPETINTTLFVRVRRKSRTRSTGAAKARSLRKNSRQEDSVALSSINGPDSFIAHPRLQDRSPRDPDYRGNKTTLRIDVVRVLRARAPHSRSARTEPPALGSAQ